MRSYRQSYVLLTACVFLAKIKREMFFQGCDERRIAELRKEKRNSGECSHVKNFKLEGKSKRSAYRTKAQDLIFKHWN